MNEDEYQLELEFQEAEFEEYAENSRRHAVNLKFAFLQRFVNKTFAKHSITKALRRYYRLLY